MQSRGSVRDATGVADTIVNQLLTKVLPCLGEMHGLHGNLGEQGLKALLLYRAARQMQHAWRVAVPMSASLLLPHRGSMQLHANSCAPLDIHAD